MLFAVRLILVARGGVEPPTFRFSVGRSYQLSYLALQKLSATGKKSATPTGLEPATSAVTGRRANQLRYGALDKAFSSYPQRDSNPCYRRERAGSWAARRWGPGNAHPDPSPLASSSSDPSRTREAYGRGCAISKAEPLQAGFAHASSRSLGQVFTIFSTGTPIRSARAHP